MKCTKIVKSFRSFSVSSATRNPHLKPSRGWGAGGGPPGNREGPQRRPVPPFPRGLLVGVCGIGEPKVCLLDQTHIDEIAAVAGIEFHVAPPLMAELQEKRSFLFKEELGNRFVEFKGEWIPTQHSGHIQLPDGREKLRPTFSCCYILTYEWLHKVVGYATPASFGTVTESDEANALLQMVRERGLTPLYHWQSRLHVRVGPVITHRELMDGYLLDNRTWQSKFPNVVPKCVPSLLDVAMNPQRYKGNPYIKYVVETPSYKKAYFLGQPSHR